MANNIPVIPQQTIFTKTMVGCYSELGRGNNARIMCVQTALEPTELDKITLIRNIRGSQKWPVRDLFQRDIDEDRVRDDIMTYLDDPNYENPKYFNPITIVLLPIDTEADRVVASLKFSEYEEVEDRGLTWEQHSVGDLFKFMKIQGQPEHTEVHWNDRRVKLVCIDGQHRISALKNLHDDPSDEVRARIAGWRIPVSILGVVRDEKDPDPDEDRNILEIVRKMFVYINTKAERIHKSRTILLDDESINCVCVQEIVQASHENDNLRIGDRDETIVPLIFFDWRGATKGGEEVGAEGSLKTIDELLSWMAELVFGEDGDDKQHKRLQLDEVEIYSQNLSRLTNPEDTKTIRKQFREIVYPGIRYLLENFTPYKEHISALRSAEVAALADSTDARHAYEQLRFGFHNAPRHIESAVADKFRQLKKDCEAMKGGLDSLMGFDIGMRAVVSAFEKTKDFRDDSIGSTASWLEHAKWFIPGINQLYADGWFRERDAQPPKDKDQKELQTHICFDHVGQVGMLYKFKAVENSFGNLLALLVVKETEDLDLADAWESFETSPSGGFKSTLKPGYRKQIKADRGDRIQGIQSEINAKLNKFAEEESNAHVVKLKEYLGLP
jgi:hypothetical protein